MHIFFAYETIYCYNIHLLIIIENSRILITLDGTLIRFVFGTKL